MSLRLILMRHAKSSWDDFTLPDHDRPLNARGRASARAMGDWLRAEGFVPDAAGSSTSRRTDQTFQGLGFVCPVNFTRALYHADAGAMLAVLCAQTASCVLMLGHNPGIAEFAYRLTSAPPPHPRFADYPTCATTVIEWQSATWDQIGWRQGALLDFAIPREVMP